MRRERNETRTRRNALRLSIRSRNAIWPSPVAGSPGIHTNPSTVFDVPAPIAPSCRTWARKYTAIRRDAASAPTTTWAPPSGSRRPARPTTTNAMSGAPTIIQASHAFSSTATTSGAGSCPAPRSRGSGTGRGRSRGPRRPPRRRSGGGAGRTPGGGVPGGRGVRGERDEVQDRRVQDDLDRHEDDDRVLPDHDPVQSDAEQRRGQDELVLDGDHGG